MMSSSWSSVGKKWDGDGLRGTTVNVSAESSADPADSLALRDSLRAIWDGLEMVVLICKGEDDSAWR